MASSYVPGSIGSLFQGEKKDDGLFAGVPADRLRAKAIQKPHAPVAKKTKRDTSRRSSEKEDKPIEKRPRHEDESDDESNHSAAAEQSDEDEDEEESVASKEERPEADEKADRTVFVGNLPLHKSEDDEDETEEVKSGKRLKLLEKALRKEFAKYGRVESVRLRSIGVKSVKVPSGSDFRLVRKVAVAKGSLDDRVETCNAYVVYEQTSSVAAAVEKTNDMKFLGNHIRVDAVREDSKGQVFDRKCSVFVGNLVFEASEEECRKHFAEALGEEAVKSVRIIKDPATNLGRGIAYVLLSDEDMVEQAIEKLNGTKIRKRAIRVNHCERSSAKKDGKLAERFKNEKKDEASKDKDASDKSFTRRKKSVLAQKSANSRKKKFQKKKAT